MDISHGGGTTAVVEAASYETPRATARELLPLTGLTAAALMAGSVAIRLSGLMISRLDEFSSIAPFGGWQLYTVAIAIGAACVAVLVTSVRFSRRQFRSVRGRTAFHRVALMAAIVPGLLLGVAVGSTLRPALNWASDQTTAAAKERAVRAAMLREYRHGPPVVSYREVDATDPRLLLLLDPRDLGPDWHASFLARAGSPTAAPGVTGDVEAVLTAQHWRDNAWQFDENLVENLTTLATPAQARAYVTHWTRHDGNVCGCTPMAPATVSADCSCRMTSRVVHGQRVSIQVITRPGSDASRRAMFAVDRNVLTLFSVPPLHPQVKPVSFKAALRAAVARAT